MAIVTKTMVVILHTDTYMKYGNEQVLIMHWNVPYKPEARSEHKFSVSGHPCENM
jgi:hypothetical protein